MTKTLKRACPLFFARGLALDVFVQGCTGTVFVICGWPGRKTEVVGRWFCACSMARRVVSGRFLVLNDCLRICGYQ